jgi:hypothetical protein
MHMFASAGIRAALASACVVVARLPRREQLLVADLAARATSARALTKHVTMWHRGHARSYAGAV